MTGSSRTPLLLLTGVCRCGHPLHEHHNPLTLSAERLAQLPPDTRSYVAGECKHYGCNEEGGLGPDLRRHCNGYVDQADPNQPSAAGTFTRAARTKAWLRLLWMGFQFRVLGRDEKTIFRRERW